MFAFPSRTYNPPLNNHVIFRQHNSLTCMCQLQNDLLAFIVRILRQALILLYTSLTTFYVGSRRIDKAIDYAVQLITNTRQLLPKIVVLLTAGRQSPGQPLAFAAKTLKEHGAKTYVVAIGDKPDVNELLPIVKDQKFVIKMSSFDDLSRRASDVAKSLGKQSGKRLIEQLNILELP